MTARPRILIVDADENLLETYERYFDQRAWSLATAISGMDCLEKLRFFTPDVLVLEPEIPWGGGSGVLAYMRDNAVLSQVPVIVVTKAWDSEELLRISDFTLSEFLVKPVSVETLAKRIHGVVELMAEKRR
ncbi:MAG: response regulator [Planctomycetia bacterium]|nr:response regulator [Planctomycetia bacterium]